MKLRLLTGIFSARATAVKKELSIAREALPPEVNFAMFAAAIFPASEDVDPASTRAKNTTVSVTSCESGFTSEAPAGATAAR